MNNSLIVLTPQNWLEKDEPFKEFATAQVKKLKKTKKELGQENSYKGYDYGIMKGRKVLFHSGAEKLRQAGGLLANFEYETLSNNNAFGIVVKCILLKDNKPIATGLGGGGAINTADKNHRGIDFEFNKGVQMARHRAFKSAIRIAYNIVDEYTQDIEEPTMKDAETKKVDERIDMVQAILKEMTRDHQFKVSTMFNIAYAYDIDPNKLITEIQQAKAKGEALQTKLLGLQEQELKSIFKSIPKEVK